MSYTTEDFTESIQRVAVDPKDVAAVEAAWGTGSGMGTDAGHFKWSADGASDWSGGFLLRLKSGAYIYLTGWCDYTGWGCQDGAEIQHFAERPAIGALTSEYKSEPPEDAWDLQPADLNRWLRLRDEAQEATTSNG